MSVEDAARGIGLEPVFQPIVTLADGAVIGYEALARWPSQTSEKPPAVFDHAREIGEIDNLDEQCVNVAVERALDGQLPDTTVIFVNCESSTTYRTGLPDDLLSRAAGRFTVIFEITERGLLSSPRSFMDKLDAIRDDGFLIALDDVGSTPESAALLDIVGPDVIKLDLSLAQSQPNDQQAQTLCSVVAHRERTGAIILAEGIETEEHLEQALAMGADLGQGLRFGTPDELKPTDSHGVWRPFRVRRSDFEAKTPSPFTLIEGHHRVRTARKETVIAFSRHIENQAIRATDPPIVLTALQRAEFLTPGTLQRYIELASRAPMVAIFGLQVPPGLDAGVRGVPLSTDDPLCAEWTVVALGPDRGGTHRPGGE